MMRKYLKSKKDVLKYLEYFERHETNTDLIQEDFCNLLTETLYKKGSGYSGPLIDILSSYDKYHLNTNTQKCLYNLIYNSFQDKNNIYYNRLFKLIDNNYFYDHFGKEILDIYENTSPSLLDYTDLLKKDIERGNKIFPIEKYKNLFINESSEVDDEIKANCFKTIEEYLKIADGQDLLDSLSNDVIINQICKKEDISTLYTFGALKKDDMSEFDYVRYLKNDYTFSDKVEDDDWLVPEIFYEKRRIISNSIEEILKEKDESNELNIYQASVLFKLLRNMDENHKKDLINIILKSDNDLAIFNLFKINDSNDEDREEEKLNNEEISMIIKKLKEDKNYFLAKEILYLNSTNPNEEFSEEHIKKLEKMVLESKDMEMIGIIALFVDNSLIKPIFKSLDNVMATLNNLEDDIVFPSKEEIKEKYYNLKKKDIESKKTNNKKNKKRLDLYLNNLKKCSNEKLNFSLRK